MIDAYTASYLAALAPLITIIAAFVTPLVSSLSSKPQRFAFFFSETVFVAVSAITFLVALHVYTANDILVYMFAGFPPPLGIIYEVDSLGALLGLLIGFVFPIVNIASYRYLESTTRHNQWYYVLYMGLEAGLLGITYTGDLFNLFVMLEVTSIAAYGLTAYLRERGKPLNAAIKYGLLGAVGSTIYFLAVVLLYSGIGTLTMADAASNSLGLPYFSVSNGIASDTVPVLVLFAGLAVWAFLIESAIFPHHFWLPDSYTSMPPAASATMAAVAEGVGAYVIMRIMYTVVGAEYLYWIQVLLMVLGSVNIVLGGYMMATTNDLKKAISYSTILDMGYVAIGIGIGSSIALAATLFYIIAHAIVKPLLFVTAGEIERITRTTDMDKLQGVLRASPIIGASLVIGGLAIIGVPPLNMFFAKLALFQAVFNAGLTPLIIVLLLGSALAFVGFARIWYSTLAVRRRSVLEKTITGALPEVKAILVLFIVATIMTGLLYGPINDILVGPAVQSLVSVTHRIMYVKQAYSIFKLIG